MLPGLGFNEMVALAVIALLVVGPRDLPLMLRKLGQWTARLRAMANEFRMGMDELARQAELDELKREVEELRRGQHFSNLEADIVKDFNAPVAGAPDDPEPAPEIPEAPPEIPPEEPDQTPPEAPPEAPPISPPAPMGPEPTEAGDVEPIKAVGARA